MSDTITLSWGDGDTICEADFDLREMAELQAGMPVARYGDVRRWSLGDQIAALRARQDQIRARMDALVTEYPALKSHSQRA